MMLSRRQLIAASAATGACMSWGAQLSATNPQRTATLIQKMVPSTSELLPVIGLGTNRWVAAGNKSVIDDLRATLITFRNLGGRVIDTAPSYQSSEKALGHLVNQLDMRDAFFLATKIDQRTAQQGLTQMQDSLDKLQTNTLDLMQIHNLFGAESQIDNLLSWKEQGLIRYIGITTSNKDQFAEMELLMTKMPLDFVQVNYSLRDQQAAERLLPLAEEKGIAVMVNRPFAHGHLFTAFAGQALPEWATEFGCQSWGQFFLKYTISHPAVTCAIPGTTKERHVRDNMGAGFGILPDKELRQRQEELFASL